MAIQAWMPWLITLIYFYVQLAMGNKDRNGFLVAAFGGILVTYYNVVTAQYGFLASNAVSFVIAVRNYRKWRKEESEHACCHGECVAGRKRRPVL